MTKREFLKKLRQTPRTWGLFDYYKIDGEFEGIIHQYDDSSFLGACPINAVTAQFGHTCGLDRKLVSTIVYAADNNYAGKSLFQKLEIWWTRRQLLKACGLA